MTDRRKLLLRAVWVAGVLGALAPVPFTVLGGSSADAADVYFLAMSLAAAIGFLTLGTLIIRNQPGNAIGWVFLGIALTFELWAFAQAYSTYAWIDHPGSLPFPTLAAWVYRWSLVPMLALFIPAFLLFPDGKVPTPRWRPVLWIWAIGTVLAVLGFAFGTRPLDVGAGSGPHMFVETPVGLGRWVDTVAAIAGAATFFTAFATGGALVARFRRSRGEVRQQIRWLVFVGIGFLVAFLTNLVVLGIVGEDNMPVWVGNLLFAIFATILVIGLPLAAGIAILKYRLYDLDIVIRKTVVVGLLTAFIAAVYALVVVLGSRAIGSGGASFVAAAVLAVAFQPARERARRLADRLVYGRRASPYEVLTEFGSRMGESYAADDVLNRMAQVLGDGTGALSARVLLRVGADLREAAAWHRDAAAEGADDPEEQLTPVVHHGDELGALAVRMPANDPMNPSRQRLVADLAAQAGLVLRNVKLIEELRASRQRLVAAQDEERRKIERDLHDGAQQQLVALAVRLKLARTLVDRDPARAGELIDAVQGAANEALDELRNLARGIYPPLLADQGLAAALQAQSRKAVVPTTVRSDGVRRCAREVETAVYFCTLEALNNVAKYAQASAVIVRLAEADGELTFTITDDGRGFDPVATGYGTGLQGMADRLDSIGRTVRVTSAVGKGTTIEGRAPVGSTS